MLNEPLHFWVLLLIHFVLSIADSCEMGFSFRIGINHSLSPAQFKTFGLYHIQIRGGEHFWSNK